MFNNKIETADGVVKTKKELKEEKKEKEKQIALLKKEKAKERKLKEKTKKEKENKRRKTLWILIGLGAVFVLLMMIISSIIDVGDKIMEINAILAYVFYGISALLIYVLVLNPIRVIVFAPSLNISSKLDKHRKQKGVYKKVAKNIMENNILTEEEENLLTNYNSLEELKEAVNTAYNGTVKEEITKIIYNNAKTVMISTAISQNSTLDMYSVITLNLKMIKEIVAASGFRPSYKNLSKLSINVLTTALVAEGLENLNMEDVIPNSAMAGISEIPFIKPVLSSVMQGTGNGLLTLRIGFVTRKYLFAELGESKQQIRMSAFKESMKMFPMLVTDIATFFPNKFLKLFSKKDKETQEV